jgi:hypothetical protein
MKVYAVVELWSKADNGYKRESIDVEQAAIDLALSKGRYGYDIAKVELIPSRYGVTMILLNARDETIAIQSWIR